MKTSNKILLSLIGLLFVIIIAYVFAFKMAIGDIIKPDSKIEDFKVNVQKN